MVMAGWPFRRLWVSIDWAPSSTRATSRTRSVEPSGSARMMMLPNSSGVTSRPMVWMFIWICWVSGIGWAPIRPTAAWMFWLRTALTMSAGVRFRLVSRSTSNQIRIE